MIAPERHFCKKPACSSYIQPWLVAIGGWWRLAVGAWWRLALGGWRLAVGGGWWWLAAVGGWWLVVGGWWSLGAVLKGGPEQKKDLVPKGPACFCAICLLVEGSTRGRVGREGGGGGCGGGGMSAPLLTIAACFLRLFPVLGPSPP